MSAGSSEVNEGGIGAEGVDLTYLTNSPVPVDTADVDYSDLNSQELTTLNQVGECMATAPVL